MHVLINLRDIGENDVPRILVTSFDGIRMGGKRQFINVHHCSDELTVDPSYR